VLVRRSQAGSFKKQAELGLVYSRPFFYGQLQLLVKSGLGAATGTLASTAIRTNLNSSARLFRMSKVSPKLNKWCAV